MIHLELQPEIEAQLAADAQARGLSIDRYVETLVTSSVVEAPQPRTPAQAVAAIRELRKGIRLDGFKIKHLIEDGRRY